MVKYYSRNERDGGHPQKAEMNDHESSSETIDVKPDPFQLVPTWHQSSGMKRNDNLSNEQSDNIEPDAKRVKFTTCNGNQNLDISSDNSACASPAQAQVHDQLSCGIVPNGSPYTESNGTMVNICKTENQNW
jgi:hypothetical protein